MLAKAVLQVVGWPILAALSWTNRERRAHRLLRMWISVGKLEAVADMLRSRLSPRNKRPHNGHSVC